MLLRCHGCVFRPGAGSSSQHSDAAAAAVAAVNSVLDCVDSMELKDFAVEDLLAGLEADMAAAAAEQV